MPKALSLSKGLRHVGGAAADLYDYEGDGLPNLMEYAFGLDPKVNSAGQLPQPVIEGDAMVIRFTPPAGVTGVTYEAVASPNLAEGSWTQVPNSGTGGEHVYRLPVSSEPGALKFMKVVVKTP
jgi:hypothetical protein